MASLCRAAASDELEAIAAFAYMQMLEAGFTWVAEFHLHHQPTAACDNVAGMSERIVAAADGRHRPHAARALSPERFLGKPPTPAQRRFVSDRDGYARLMETRAGGHRHRAALLRAVTLATCSGRRLAGRTCRRTSIANRRARSAIASPPMAGRHRETAARHGRVDAKSLVPGPRHACQRR
jgi:hypothetical protein